MTKVCEYCGNDYHPQSLLRHKRSQHPDELDVECPTCDDLFEDETGMFHHHANVHGESLAKEMIECRNCEEEFEAWKYRDGAFCDEECYYEYRDGTVIAGENNPCHGLFGEDHPAWRGGSIDARGIEWGTGWLSLREEVLERDDGQCRVCGCDERPHVHHIVPRRFAFFHPFLSVAKDLNVKENLITLCTSHHQQAERGDIEFTYEVSNSDFSIV